MKILRILCTSLIVAVLAAAASTVLSPHASAAGTSNKPAADLSKTPVRVIEVTGYLDPIMADFIEKEIDITSNGKYQALVIRFDSSDSFLTKQQRTRLLSSIRSARIPIAVWVGGSGASATNKSYDIARSGDVLGVSTPVTLGKKNNFLSAQDAVNQKVAQIRALVLRDFLIQLHGKNIKGRVLDTAEITQGKEPRSRIVVPVSFSKPKLLAGFLHAAASPSIAYLFLVTGLLLIMFEFFAVSIGLSAVSGILLLIPSAYGLGILPINVWALTILILSMFAFAIDIQAGASRAWTAIGFVMFVLGSWFLYSGRSLPLLTFIPVALFVVVFVLAALPSTIRSRFSLPIVGREWMIGEMGFATTDVDPDGIVDIRGGTWPARTNRATPIAQGDAVRIVAIEGRVLEVEPEEGGAKEAHH